MRKVIRIEEQKEEKALKPIEFTHILTNDNGWCELKKLFNGASENTDKVVYLGNTINNGHMFAVYMCSTISIYKGHLNDGVY